MKPHWAGLDGLRAIAVLAVVFYHASPLGISVNGYVGVDVFFVLSGFLITSLLLRELDVTGRVDLGAFYMRRILRLYPALLACLAGVVVLAALAGRLSVVGPASLAALFYLSNWWLYTGHEAPLLEHTWTLAIEEHFYALWPAILLAFRRHRPPAVLALLALAVVTFTPWPIVDGVRGSYLRGVPIVWGCALALLRRRLPALPSPAGGAALSALALVCVAPAALPSWLLTGWTSLPGLLSVLVVWSITDGRLALLRWRPAVWIGRRAYGIYLYHFPVISLLLHQVTTGPLVLRAALAVFVSLAVAAVSYELIERPFLRLKSRFSASPTRTTPFRESAPSD